MKIENIRFIYDSIENVEKDPPFKSIKIKKEKVIDYFIICS
jgi:hypothetical protein